VEACFRTKCKCKVDGDWWGIRNASTATKASRHWSQIIVDCGVSCVEPNYVVGGILWVAGMIRSEEEENK